MHKFSMPVEIIARVVGRVGRTHAGCRTSLSLSEPFWNDISRTDGLLEVSADWLAVPTR
jgi:predicted DNA-binding ribbon-helix-helix protein